ncbi:MAG: glycosyltransferase family 4 protein [Candidatus Omnitrophica bacterium]|nr:glycosyltransferase family 4 protein [Candidatus Omnitrophota bacterium]
MRIGIIHWGFPPRAGGVEAHLTTLCPELVRLGHQVFVLTETMPGVACEQSISGVKVIRRKELSAANLDKWAKQKRDLYAKVKPVLESFLTKNRISVVHAHNIHMDFFDFARALTDISCEKAIPCIAILHNHIFIDRNMRPMKRIIAGLPWARIISVSQFIKGKIIRSVPGVDRNKLGIILHGIDLKKFSPLTSKEKDKIKAKYKFSGRRIILHPARIMPWKGIVPAIRAMPKIVKRFPQSLMVLTGRIKPIHKDQSEISRYNNLVDKTIKRLNLKDYVYMGKYTYRDIPFLTKIAEVVIYTTIKDEPFGLCPVEAMACAVPAIVTSSGGLKESVIQGETGYIIEKDEKKLPGQLAEKVIKLFSQPKLRKSMGRSGRQRAKTHFALVRMAEDFINVSREVINRKGCR